MLTPDLAPTELGRQVRHSKGVVEDHLAHESSKLDGYIGRYFNRHQKGRVDDPTNTAFEFIGLMIAEAAGGHPKWDIDCEVMGPGKQIADALTIALNAHAKENYYEVLAQKLLVDFCLNWAITATFPESRPDRRNLLGGGNLYAPVTRRLEAKHAFWDVTDTSVGFESTAFRGHRGLRTYRDMKEEGGWNMDAVLRLAKYNDDNRDSLWTGRDVLGYDIIYVPGATPEMIRELGYSTEQYERALDETPHQYNGWLFYMGQTGKDDMTEFIRSPEPFFGPAMGPYTRFEGYPVPGSTFTGSTLTFTSGQQADLNEAERAILQSESDYKVVIAYEAENDTVARKITDAKSGDAVAVPALSRGGQPLFQTFPLGGADPNMHNTVNRRRIALDRNLGVSDEQKGNSNTGVTATASSIAATAGQSRIGWQTGKFAEGMNQIGYLNAWYMFHDPLYARSLPQSGRTGRFVEMTEDGMAPVLDPKFVGGEDPEQTYTFDDFLFKFDYMSVRHKTEGQRLAQSQEITNTMLAAGPAMVQFPFYNWSLFWEHQAETHNLPWMESLVNYSTLQEVAGIEIEAKRDVRLEQHSAGKTQFNLAAPQGRANNQPPTETQPPQPQPVQSQEVKNGPVQ